MTNVVSVILSMFIFSMNTFAIENMNNVPSNTESKIKEQSSADEYLNCEFQAPGRLRNRTVSLKIDKTRMTVGNDNNYFVKIIPKEPIRKLHETGFFPEIQLSAGARNETEISVSFVSDDLQLAINGESRLEVRAGDMYYYFACWRDHRQAGELIDPLSITNPTKK